MLLLLIVLLYLINGHVPGGRGDFQFCLPVRIACGGVALILPGAGVWHLHGNYTYCGAAWVMGKDGKRYMHAFYR